MIRSMQSADIETLIEIHRLSHIEEYTLEPYPIAPQGVRDDAALSDLFNKSTFYVHEFEGHVRGFIGYIDSHIIWLYVHPDYRSRHIGKTLVTALLKALAGQAVSLIVVKSNEAAVSFYKALGFTEEGEFEAMYQGYPIKGLKLVCANQ